MGEISGMKKAMAIVAASMTGMTLVGAVFHCRDGKGSAKAGTGEGVKGDHGMESGHYFDDVLAGLAAELELSGTELESELADGRSIMDIAAEKSTTLDDMVDAMILATEKALEQEILAGDLSLEMADSIETDLAEFFAWNLERGGGWLRREHAWKH